MNQKSLIGRWAATLLMSLCCLLAFAQGKNVTGTVTDPTGEPLIGVSVQVKGAKQGAITDFDGNFKLANVPEGSTLVFSYIGYVTEEARVGAGNAPLKITLREDAQSLEEVVVIGYGSVKKKDITGSVATVDADALVAVPVASAVEALQGKLAGVQITTTEGSPDAEMKIRVRGGGSITQSNDPLYIVDGFPVDNISDIPTTDIEDITVLKDASSTAIYGTKAANGVLLITTKKGAKGKTNFTFSSKFTVKKEPASIPMLNGDEYVAYMQDAIWNTANAQGLQNSSSLLELLFDTPEIGYMPSWRYFDEYNADTDWLSTVTKDAWIFDNSFSMSGGGEKATYRFSLSYMNEGGTTIGTGLDRITANYNLTYRFSDKFDMYAEFSYTDTQKDEPYTDKLRAEAMRKMPNKSPYWIDDATGLPTSNYFIRQNSEEFQGAYSSGKNFHPIIMANDSYNKTYQREERITYRANYHILPGFTWTGWVAMKFKTVKTRQFLPQTAGDFSIDNTNANYSYDGYSNNLSLLTENKFIFRRQFGIHGLTATALWRTEQSRSSNSAEAVYGVASPGMSDPVAGGAITSLGSGTSESRIMGAVGMVNYTLFDRYVFTFTVNGEGRSSLSKENRWGIFPSAGVAWHMQDEYFMESLDWWNQLKLRASWGQSGNAPNGTAPYIGTYSAIGNYNTNAAIAPSTMQLNKLKWETSTEYNVGTDLAFMDNKMTMTFDYYHKVTDDLLQTKVTIPSSVGYSSGQLAYFNSGKLSNTGWEYRIDYEIFKNKDWTVSANFNINRNVNKILELPENLSEETFSLSNGSYAQRLETGVAVGSFYGFRYNGVYQNTQDTYARDAEGNIMYNLQGEPIVMKNGSYVCYPGDAKYEDINHDGKIDENDVVYLGNCNPMVTGGGGVNVKWKYLALTIFFHYRLGQKVINTARMDAEAMYNRDNQSTAVLNRWRSEGDVTDIPRALYDYGLNYLGSDRFVEDCSYLRLKTLSLSYSIPKRICKKMKINGLNVFVTGYDLLTFTNYKGQDPEVSLPSKVTDLSEDDAQTPRSRRFSFGFNINF